MIDIIELMANLFETFDKHFMPYFNRKLKAIARDFKQEFYKKMLVLHLEENKKLLEKINTQEAIKNALEKHGTLETPEQANEIKKLRYELQENNNRIEKLKGEIKND